MMDYITAIPVLIQEDCIELTTENTAFLLDEESLLEGNLKQNEKYADFKGHQVIVDRNTGVVQHGQFKGKRVNLVKDRQRNIKNIYKQVDKGVDRSKYKASDKKYRREHETGYFAAGYGGYGHVKGHDDTANTNLPCLLPRIHIQNAANKELDNRKKEYVRKKASDFRIQKAKSDDEYRNRYKKDFDIKKHHMERDDTRELRRDLFMKDREAEKKSGKIV